MVNIANINLGKNLSKLSVRERLNIMMHYRAAEFLSKQTPISELEYNTLDASIRTNEDIRAYNKMNEACHNLFAQFDYITKCAVNVQLQSHHFKLLWVTSKQAEFTMDGVNHFLYALRDKLHESGGGDYSYDGLIAESLSKSSAKFLHSCEVETDEEGSNWLRAKFKEGECYEQRAEELKAAFAKLEAEIAEYHEMVDRESLNLKPFSDAIPEIFAEAQRDVKWLEKLEEGCC